MARPDLHPPAAAVRDVVERALGEDLLPLGDLTASLVDPELVATAAFVPRAPGVLAGRTCADEVLARVDTALVSVWTADDGDDLLPGEPFGRVTGPLRSILTAERTALNLLCHLSGVATLTRRYVEAAGGRARIRDTRKTTPGLRALEKAAVRAGGGVNHRGSLSEALLVKDNHLAGTSITAAVALARERWPGREVQVECDSLEEVGEALAAGADSVLLDNMDADGVAAAVQRVAGRVAVEVSGGVTLERVTALGAAGPDWIAVGALTHSAPALDIGLDLDPAAPRAETPPGG